MNIDWSKAPEWAVAHGLHETGFGIKEFWLGETQHQNLEHAKPFKYGGGDPSCGSFHNSRRESFSYVTERPTAWSGEGLPPVGTECEFQGDIAKCPDDPWHKDLRDGVKCKVIAHFKSKTLDLVAFTFVKPDGYSEVQQSLPGALCPIRTPEQIAAEEREAALTDIALLMGKDPDRPRIREMAAILYDAGYRKQVKP